MATQQQIRDAIKAKMLTVANVGQVHTFERYAASLADLKTLYLSGGKILGWNIRLIRALRSSLTMGRIEHTLHWKIKGYMGLDDPTSELAFDVLVEALQDAFTADETLGGLVGGTVLDDEGNTAGLQRDDAGPVMFCGVLSHAVELRLLTRHHT
jgi:hypothetical protein